MNFLQALSRRECGQEKITPDKIMTLSKLQCARDDIFVMPRNEEPSIPYQSRFCPVSGYQNIYSLGTEEGSVLFVDSTKPASRGLLWDWSAHDNAIFDLCWTDKNRIITAAGDKTAMLWDATSKTKLATCSGHSCTVKSIALQPSNHNVFATGARDGNILLWDVRCRTEGSICTPSLFIGDAHDASQHKGTPQPKRRRLVQNLKSINPLNSVTSIIFQDDHLLFSCGSSDRTIKGWDFRYLSHYDFQKTKLAPIEVNYPGSCQRTSGYANLVLHPNRGSFFASCTDGNIYRYTCSNRMPQLISSYYGHKMTSFFVKMDLNGDGEFLLSGSTDSKAYIWKVSEPGLPKIELSGHEGDVNAVTWCPSDITRLITCSDDDKIYQWTINPEIGFREISPSDVVGHSLLLLPEDVSRNSKWSNLSIPHTPNTPSTRKVLQSMPLTRWLTPKQSFEESLAPPTPPITPKLEVGNCITPERESTRTVLSNLSFQRNVIENESFVGIKKRLMNEKVSQLPLRRTLLLEERMDDNLPGTSSSFTSLPQSLKENSNVNKIYNSNLKKEKTKDNRSQKNKIHSKKVLKTKINSKNFPAITNFFKVSPTTNLKEKM